MTMRAKHKVSGVTVSADEAVLRRLGPEWEVGEPAEEKKPVPRKRAAAKKSDGD